MPKIIRANKTFAFNTGKKMNIYLNSTALKKETISTLKKTALIIILAIHMVFLARAHLPAALPFKVHLSFI